MNTHVLYHACCPDGFAAAFAAWLNLGDTATYTPVAYGEPPPEIPDGSHVSIVDFSYSRPILEKMRAAAASLIVLGSAGRAI